MTTSNVKLQIKIYNVAFSVASAPITETYIHISPRRHCSFVWSFIDSFRIEYILMKVFRLHAMDVAFMRHKHIGFKNKEVFS